MYVDVSQRFTQVIKYLLDSRILRNQTELGLTLSLSKGYVSQLVNGQREPSGEVVSKLANSFPMINEDWILSGMGSMLKNQEQPQNFQEETPSLETKLIAQLSATEIVLRDMLAEERAKNDALNEVIWELKEENGKLKALLCSERKGGTAANADFSSAVDAI